ncbi:MAG: 30S ribosomal protein S2, partial [Lacticaseibacillus rhamnosus]
EDDQEQQPAADKKADSMEDIVEAVEGDNKRAN